MPVLYSTTFRALEPEWDQPGCGEYGRTGLRVDSGKESARLNGPGIHTRNGDTVELQIEWTTAKRGFLRRRGIRDGNHRLPLRQGNPEHV